MFTGPVKHRITIDPSPTQKGFGRIAIHKTESYDSPELWACNYDPTSPRSIEQRDEWTELAIRRLGIAHHEFLDDER